MRVGLVLAVLLSLPVEAKICADGFTANGYGCFRLFTDVVTWYTAESRCRALGSYLAPTDSKGMHTAAKAILKAYNDAVSQSYRINGYWIGLTDSRVNKKWETTTGYTFITTSGFNPWYRTGRGHCAFAYDGALFWGDWPCGSTINQVGGDIGFMCWHQKCKTGWHYWPKSRKCYKAAFTPKTWSSAFNYGCSWYGSQLATIHNKAEHDYVTKELPAKYGRGVGGTYWIALSIHDDGSYRWHDGSPLNYANWLPGQPNGTLSPQGCTKGLASYAGWRTSNPTTEWLTSGSSRYKDCAVKHSYVCEYKIDNGWAVDRACPTGRSRTSFNYYDTVVTDVTSSSFDMYCHKCARGRYNSDVYSTCTLCPKGQFQNATGATGCKSGCPVGRYATQYGLSSCLATRAPTQQPTSHPTRATYPKGYLYDICTYDEEVVTAPNGTLSNPRQHNRNCSVTLEAPKGSLVYLVFEGRTEDDYDHVFVYDGPSRHDTQLQELSGSLDDIHHVSTTRWLTVRWVSDHNGAHYQWNATWTMLRGPTKKPTKLPTQTPTRLPSVAPTMLPTTLPTLPPTTPPSRPPTSLPTTLPSTVPTMLPTTLPTSVPTFTPSTPPTTPPSMLPTTVPTRSPTTPPTPLPANVTREICNYTGQTITVEGASVISREAPNLNCVVIIEAPPAKIVILTIRGKTERYHDYLRVYNGTKVNNESQIIQLSGPIAAKLRSKHRCVTLQWRTDDSKATAGVRVSWTFADRLTPKPTAVPTLYNAGFRYDVCRFNNETLTQTSGVIVGPKQGLIAARTRCVCTIHTSALSRIGLTLSGSFQAGESVTVYDGRSYNASSLLLLGSGIVDDSTVYYSSSSYLTLLWQSSTSNLTASQWNLSWFFPQEPTRSPTTIPTRLPTSTPTLAPTRPPTSPPTQTPTRSPLSGNGYDICAFDGEIVTPTWGYLTLRSAANKVKCVVTVGSPVGHFVSISARSHTTLEAVLFYDGVNTSYGSAGAVVANRTRVDSTQRFVTVEWRLLAAGQANPGAWRVNWTSQSVPTSGPTPKPTQPPTTRYPTRLPSVVPTMLPTFPPTRVPTTTLPPTALPTGVPSSIPTALPTTTKTPTKSPTTSTPTEAPVLSPTVSLAPTVAPTRVPTGAPSTPCLIYSGRVCLAGSYSAPHEGHDDINACQRACMRDASCTYGVAWAQQARHCDLLRSCDVHTNDADFTVTTRACFSLVCEAGRYARKTCIDCPTGRYQSVSGSRFCRPCSAGRYAGSSRSTKCTVCATGKVQSQQGRAACVDCPSGRIANSAKTYCVDTPTSSPTSLPTPTPTAVPTAQPTEVPTSLPTELPTVLPTALPTTTPSSTPTGLPTTTPTQTPSSSPTVVPTKLPTVSPSTTPSMSPTKLPTSTPTRVPSSVPTVLPTTAPTKLPSSPPSKLPTSLPTVTPSSHPTTPPTLVPTSLPSLTPTLLPTSPPSLPPTNLPSSAPTQPPTKLPSLTPTLWPTSTWQSCQTLIVGGLDELPHVASNFSGVYAQEALKRQWQVLNGESTLTWQPEAWTFYLRDKSSPKLVCDDVNGRSNYTAFHETENCTFHDKSDRSRVTPTFQCMPIPPEEANIVAITWSAEQMTATSVLPDVAALCTEISALANVSRSSVYRIEVTSTAPVQRRRLLQSLQSWAFKASIASSHALSAQIATNIQGGLQSTLADMSLKLMQAPDVQVRPARPPMAAVVNTSQGDDYSVLWAVLSACLVLVCVAVLLLARRRQNKRREMRPSRPVTVMELPEIGGAAKTRSSQIPISSPVVVTEAGGSFGLQARDGSDRRINGDSVRVGAASGSELESDPELELQVVEDGALVDDVEVARLLAAAETDKTTGESLDWTI